MTVVTTRIESVWLVRKLGRTKLWFTRLTIPKPIVLGSGYVGTQGKDTCNKVISSLT